MAAYSGRDPATVPALVKLAETLAAPVIEGRVRMNFPSDHPLHLGYAVAPYLKKADAILIVDFDVPYIPAADKPVPGTRVIHIDTDPIKEGIPMWSFPGDLFIRADSATAIPALTAELRRIQIAQGHVGRRHQVAAAIEPDAQVA